MNKTLLSMLLLSSSTMAFASLISVGTVLESGAGLGTVSTLLTLTSSGSTTTESGCVGAGVGGAEIIGSTVCAPGIFTGGSEQAINNTYTLSTLGIANFGNLQLILNGTEVGAGALQSITLDSMALTLFDPANGALLASFYTIGPIDFDDVFAGVGNAGYGFQLDAAQAAIANGFLASTPGLYIGVSANLSNATGGQETIFVRNVSTPLLPPEEVIPEPATLALMGSALISLGLLRRRAARKQ